MDSSDSWFKSEILDGIKRADLKFINPTTNDGAYGNVAVQLRTPSGSDVLD